MAKLALSRTQRTPRRRKVQGSSTKMLAEHRGCAGAVTLRTALPGAAPARGPRCDPRLFPVINKPLSRLSRMSSLSRQAPHLWNSSDRVHHALDDRWLAERADLEGRGKTIV